MDVLRALNHLRVPVVTFDGRSAYAGDLDEVADFLGIARTGHRMLSPHQLAEKYRLQSRSTGLEPNRRVRIFKTEA